MMMMERFVENGASMRALGPSHAYAVFLLHSTSTAFIAIAWSSTVFQSFTKATVLSTPASSTLTVRMPSYETWVKGWTNRSPATLLR